MGIPAEAKALSTKRILFPAAILVEAVVNEFDYADYRQIRGVANDEINMLSSNAIECDSSPDSIFGLYQISYTDLAKHPVI